MTMYLWHSEGMSRRNMGLLYAAGELISKHGGPWLLGADFNMTPDDLALANEWLLKVGGVIRAPATPT